MTNEPASVSHESVSRRTYGIIFVILVVITLAELALASLNLDRSLKNTVFFSMAIVKAALVAAIYMHLRYDSRFYTFVFVAPAALIFLFAVLTLLV